MEPHHNVEKESGDECFLTYLVVCVTLSQASSCGTFSHGVHRGSSRNASVVSWSLLAVLGGGLNCKVTNRRQLRLATSVGGLWSLTRHGQVFSCFRGSLCVSSGFWQELLEVFEQVRSCVKEERYLSVDVLNGFGFSLISLENFQELLVDFWSVLKSILWKLLVLLRFRHYCEIYRLLLRAGMLLW